MAKPKRYGEQAVKNRARPNNDEVTGGETVVSVVDLAPGDTAWNPAGPDIAEATRVIYYFHENGETGAMECVHDIPTIG